MGENQAHAVIIEKNSKLFEILGKRDVIMVNSIHQKVAEIDSVKNCKIVGICPLDNTVEAIEIDNKKFAIGVKWHPEFMENMNSLFESFIKNC